LQQGMRDISPYDDCVTVLSQLAQQANHGRNQGTNR